MSFKKFLTEQEQQNAQEKEEKLMGAIMDFFTSHEKPSDKDVHDLAEKLGIDEHDFEAKIYELLSSFLNAGKYKQNPPEDVNEEELKRGIEVEMEHTNSPALSRRIALDHLAEIPDYYTRLDKMEKEAGIKDKGGK
jgi:hypothetical protein